MTLYLAESDIGDIIRVVLQVGLVILFFVVPVIASVLKAAFAKKNKKQLSPQEEEARRKQMEEEIREWERQLGIDVEEPPQEPILSRPEPVRPEPRRVEVVPQQPQAKPKPKPKPKPVYQAPEPITPVTERARASLNRSIDLRSKSTSTEEQVYGSINQVSKARVQLGALSRSDLKRAILLKEILDQPVALRKEHLPSA